MGNKQGSCRDCNKPYSEVKPRQCPLCHGMICNYCIEHPVLLEKDVQAMKITLVCRDCFKTNADLDFSRPKDVIGPEHPHPIIWLHGGGSCRKMFELQAQYLQTKGYRSILVDLPGHGAELYKELTLEACIQSVWNARKDCGEEAPILIGGSFGGYIAMEVIGRYPKKEHFQAAVVMMCGQNVGEGRGLMASIGLWGMEKAIKIISSEKLVNGLIKAAKNVDKAVLANLLRSGYYFQQGAQQIQILKTTNPVPCLQKFEGKVLFINGSKDHRDSEQRWKSACKDSQVIIYENGDHFFSHDKRFLNQLNEDILKFADSIFKAQEKDLHEQTSLPIKSQE